MGLTGTDTKFHNTNMSKKIKILIFHPYLAPYRIDLYNKLSQDYDIFVLLTGSPKEILTLGFNLNLINAQAEFKYKYITDGIRIGRHLVSSVFVKTIHEFKPDIIFTHELGLNTLFTIWAKTHQYNYKIYTTIDDSPTMAKSYGWKREFLRQYIAKRINGFIVVNPEVKDYLEGKYKTTQNQTIYFPIIQDDIILSNKINQASEKAISLQEQYGLQQKRIILFVGRLEAIKCPDLLLHTFKDIQSDKDVLVIVGDGNLSDKLHNYIENNNLKNVIMPGRLSGMDLYAWYYLANIFVLPSKFEPFGAVVNEALVAGCYTIVSNKVGASALINEQNGVVIDINDNNSFRDTLIRSLKKIKDQKEHKSLMDKPFTEYYKTLINKLGL